MTLTVLITYYNQAKLLSYCLDSIMQYRNAGISVEALITAFGPTDEPDVKNYPGVRVHSRKEDALGMSEQLNEGLKLTTGDVITWVPADNALTAPHLYGHIIHALQYYDIVYTDMVYIDDDGRFVFIRQLSDYEFHTCFDTYELGVSIWYKRSLHDEIGLFNTDYQVHDYEWLLRCAEAGKTFYHLPQSAYIYRMHTDEKGEHKRVEGNWVPERYERFLREAEELSKRAKER